MATLKRAISYYSVWHNNLMHYQEIYFLAKILSPFKRTLILRQRIDSLSYIEVQSAVAISY